MSDKLIHDQGRVSDWGRTSKDYALYRPGYPASFYQRITALGVGLPGQRVLDLGTGTGNVGRALAKLGCKVTGVDISEPQIAEAKRLAIEEGLDAKFLVAPAEVTQLPGKSFDVITAAQSFLYFDLRRAIEEVKRLLAKEGRLVTCHIGWLPREDDVARQTEELVLKFNPNWTAANVSGEILPVLDPFKNDFRVTAFFVYKEQIPFTHASWRGRIRACRAIGASIPQEQIETFDKGTR